MLDCDWSSDVCSSDLSPEQLHAPRLWNQSADLVIGCDMVVTTSPATLDMVAPDTEIIVNTEVVPTAQFQSNNAIDFSANMQLAALRGVVGDHVEGISATAIATELMGDSITTNMFMFGYAVQKGFVPLSLTAIEEAIRMNGAQVKSTLQVFNWGRLAAHDKAQLDGFLARTGVHAVDEPLSETLDELISRRVKHLTGWQNAAWADRYSAFVDKVRAAEAAAGLGGSLKVTEGVARYLSKLMSYKDEYEVARLYTSSAYRERLNQAFEGNYKLQFHLGANLLFAGKDSSGNPRKRALPGWLVEPGLRVLTKLKGLRGGVFDIFGYNPERRMERRLIEEYLEMIEQVLPRLTPGTQATITAIAELPELIKGYGSIKEGNVAIYEAEKAKLVASLDAPAATAA
jgi:indolepyruvate ferredoxin oxidoreductase